MSGLFGFGDGGFAAGDGFVEGGGSVVDGGGGGRSFVVGCFVGLRCGKGTRHLV